MTLMAMVTPNDVTARGNFTMGDAIQNITMPEDADQIAALSFTLDPAADPADGPADLYLEPATGQVEIAAGVPAGWTATEFDIWANAAGLGTTIPVRDADGDLLDLTTLYAILIKADGPLEISAEGATHPAWGTGPVSAPGALSGQHLLLTEPTGWVVAADQQILITNQSAVANNITIILLGK